MWTSVRTTCAEGTAITLEVHSSALVTMATPSAQTRESVKVREPQPHLYDNHQKFHPNTNFAADINECIITVCKDKEVCENTPGSFQCVCPPGTMLSGDECVGKDPL